MIRVAVLKYVFPLINGFLCLALFWLVASSIYRDFARVSYWSAGGFAFGFLVGIALQSLILHFSLANNPIRKKLILARKGFN